MWLVFAALLLLGYPASYAAVRLTHALTHTAWFVSSEGLDGHTVHGMEGDHRLQLLFAPVIGLEVSLHRLHSP